ncbi:PLC-like phosphodiesterase, partial [Coemansia spiralis]
VCNQHSELCSRAYNDVTFISTHASFALTNATRPSVPGTQYKSITQQLNDGVRGLHLNIVQGTKATDVWLCYPDCNVNNGGTLQDTLSTVKSWMDSNKNDVVTIFLEGNATTASPSAVLSAFTQSGIDKYALTGKPTTWPTLGSMIDDGTTLVVFAESTA